MCAHNICGDRDWLGEAGALFYSRGPTSSTQRERERETNVNEALDISQHNTSTLPPAVCGRGEAVSGAKDRQIIM